MRVSVVRGCDSYWNWLGTEHNGGLLCIWWLVPRLCESMQLLEQRDTTKFRDRPQAVLLKAGKLFCQCFVPLHTPSKQVMALVSCSENIEQWRGGKKTFSAVEHYYNWFVSHLMVLQGVYGVIYDCRRLFPRSLWSKKLISIWVLFSVVMEV